MTTTLEPRVLWGRYRLDDLRLTGRWFEAYVAHDLVLDRTVVVKLCRFPADAGQDLQRERAAATRTAALAHHGIVPLLDIALETLPDGAHELGLVFEYAEGRTVARAVRESGPMTAKQAGYLGFDVAEALAYLHGRGVVSRGVVPTNVVLADQSEGRPQARLLDLSNALPAGAVVPGGVVTVDGLPSAEADHAADPADDVLDLGRLLSGALLGPDAEGLPAAPEALVELLRSAVAVEPADRPSAAELAVALREFTAREFGRHRRVPQAPSPDADEEARLAELHRYDLLDTPPEGAFDRITGLASRTFGMPVSTVSIVDRDRIWFKSHHGVDAEQIGRDPGLCAAVVETGGRIHVPDARAEASTRDNPLIAGDQGLQCYVGVPLTSADGFTLGALSVAGYEPHEFTSDELEVLDELGRFVTHEMEMRRAARRAALSRER